jgi:hypothetical protein
MIFFYMFSPKLYIILVKKLNKEAHLLPQSLLFFIGINLMKVFSSVIAIKKDSLLLKLKINEILYDS